jgi:hypothetical protein
LDVNRLILRWTSETASLIRSKRNNAALFTSEATNCYWQMPNVESRASVNKVLQKQVFINQGSSSRGLGLLGFVSLAWLSSGLHLLGIGGLHQRHPRGSLSLLSQTAAPLRVQPVGAHSGAAAMGRSRYRRLSFGQETARSKPQARP